MSRPVEYRELEPIERRIALMHVAGASPYVIAEALVMQPTYIETVLKRPRVQRFCLVLHGLASDGLEEGIKDLNAAFKASASRAFDLEKEAMETMYDFSKDDECKPTTRIRAAMGVTFTARDILDRAGYRAPTKVYTYGNNEITPEAAEALAGAARELRALREADRGSVGERTLDVTPPHVELPPPASRSNGDGSSVEGTRDHSADE